MAKYPKVNYIGNKEKLAGWIIEEFPIKNGKVLDLFSGGCSISYALKKAGFSVIANDVLFANYIIAKAIIENNSVCLTDTVFDISINKSAIKRMYNKIEFLTNNLFFENEVIELSRLLCVAENLNEYERYMFLSLLRRAMIRKLPYSRMNVPWSQIELLRNEEYSYKKYGRKRAYHNQSFEYHMRHELVSYNEALMNEGNACYAYNLDAFKLVEHIDFIDAIYIDPPYPSTMNNYDAFYGAFDKIFSALKTHTDFTKINSFLENLEQLIVGFKNKARYIVLSINDKVQPKPDEIVKMMKKYGTIEIKSKPHNYQVTGKQNKSNSNELMIILQL